MSVCTSLPLCHHMYAGALEVRRCQIPWSHPVWVLETKLSTAEPSLQILSNYLREIFRNSKVSPLPVVSAHRRQRKDYEEFKIVIGSAASSRPVLTILTNLFPKTKFLF